MALPGARERRASAEALDEARIEAARTARDEYAVDAYVITVE